MGKEQYISINPFTGETEFTADTESYEQVVQKLNIANDSQKNWARLSLEARKKYLPAFANALKKNADEYGKLISREMGKPLKAAIAEVNKCATVPEFCAENIHVLADKELAQADAIRNFTAHEPLGVIYGIMPWNYPFWQVIRFAVPAIAAGNTVVVKHAGSVPQCALAIEKLFQEVFETPGIYQNLFIDFATSDKVIAHPIIKGVSLTGSERAGSAVGAATSKAIKPLILELGGSDAFIVTEDVDLAACAKEAVTGRFQNNGQSCVASKRFIVQSSIYEDFRAAFLRNLNEYQMGDPLRDDTKLGPQAREDLRDELKAQVDETVAAGATFTPSDHQVPLSGWFIQPGILEEIPEGSRAFSEELFGPVASFYKYEKDEEAIQIANATTFGLGGTVYCRDRTRALQLARNMNTGNVYLNRHTVSNAALPFGGTCHSGIGKEMSLDGLLNFVNRKTISVA